MRTYKGLVGGVAKYLSAWIKSSWIGVVVVVMLLIVPQITDVVALRPLESRQFAITQRLGRNSRVTLCGVLTPYPKRYSLETLHEFGAPSRDDGWLLLQIIIIIIIIVLVFIDMPNNCHDSERRESSFDDEFEN